MTTRADAAGRSRPPVLGAFLSLPVGCALGLALYPRRHRGAGDRGGAGASWCSPWRWPAMTRRSRSALGLLGVQVVDPAPADGVFVVVMAVAFATRRFHLSAVPRPVLAMLAVFAALNVMASIQVVDEERASSSSDDRVPRAVRDLAGRLYELAGARCCSSRLSRLGGHLVLVGRARAARSAARRRPADGERPQPAFFQDPNVFGPFLIPPALILIEEIVRPRLLPARLVTKASLLAVLLVGILFSYSRGAWVNLGIALVVLGLILSLRGGARTAATLFAVTALTAAVIATVVVATGSGDFLAERARPQTYDTDRFSGQRAGLRPAAEYPFGAGPGQFESVAHISAHSTYARALGEQGYPGLLTLLALLGFTLFAALRNAVAGRGTYGIGSAALLAAWCGLLANSAVIDTLHWRHLWVVAALIWAATVARGRRA